MWGHWKLDWVLLYRTITKQLWYSSMHVPFIIEKRYSIFFAVIGEVKGWWVVNPGIPDPPPPFPPIIRNAYDCCIPTSFPGPSNARREVPGVGWSNKGFDWLTWSWIQRRKTALRNAKLDKALLKIGTVVGSLIQFIHFLQRNLNTLNFWVSCTSHYQGLHLSLREKKTQGTKFNSIQFIII